jgi:hypothetical protein
MTRTETFVVRQHTSPGEDDDVVGPIAPCAWPFPHLVTPWCHRGKFADVTAVATLEVAGSYRFSPGMRFRIIGAR